MINYKRNGQDVRENRAVATDWTLSPLDTRVTITTPTGIYEMTKDEKQPFARIGKVDADNIMVVDYRSNRAIKASDSIKAYSLIEDA